MLTRRSARSEDIDFARDAHHKAYRVVSERQFGPWNEASQDEFFRREWEAGESQYQLVREIIKARIDKKISQRQLARRANTTQAVISRVESMSVNPSILLIEKIAHALDKKLDIKFIPR